MQQVPIDLEIQRVQAEIQQRRLDLKQVNLEMANIRAHYQQRGRIYGGGVFKLARAFQQGAKDGALKSHQPKKEKLQREKLALEQQLNQLKLMKAQGVMYVKR